MRKNGINEKSRPACKKIPAEGNPSVLAQAGIDECLYNKHVAKQEYVHGKSKTKSRESEARVDET